MSTKSVLLYKVTEFLNLFFNEAEISVFSKKRSPTDHLYGYVHEYLSIWTIGIVAILIVIAVSLMMMSFTELCHDTRYTIRIASNSFSLSSNAGRK